MTISPGFRHVAAITATAAALGLGAFSAAPAQAQTARPASTVTPASVESCSGTTTGYTAVPIMSPNGQDACALFGDRLSYARFGPGQYVQAAFSTGLTSTLIMQTDGNLVLRLSTGKTWGAGTRTSGYYAKLQTDGNFVVYNAGGTAVWAAPHTRNSDGTELCIQSDGNLVAYDEISGAVLWAAF